MSKYIKFFIAFSLMFSVSYFDIGTVLATDVLEADELVFNDGETAEDYLDRVPDIELVYGDTVITKEDIETGIEIQNKMNSKRMNEEVWTLTSSVTYKEFAPIKGKYYEKIASGESRGYSGGLSFSVSKILKYGITVSPSITFNVSYTRNGPSGTEKVGSNTATHRYFVAVGSAKIMKYTYKITDKYTGNFMRNETRYIATNKKTTTYGVLGCYNAATDKVTIKSVSNNNTKTYSESTFISKCSTEEVWAYIGF